MKFRARRSIILIFLLVSFLFVLPSPGSFGESHFAATEKADPLLSYLLARDRELKEKGKEGLDLLAFSGSLEVYHGGGLAGIPGSIAESEFGEEGDKAVGLEFRREAKLGLLIKFESPASFVHKPGLSVISRIGSIATAKGGLEAISALIDDPAVEYVSPSKPVRPTLDQSLPLVGAKTLHATSPVDRGKGNLLGVVDTGIDYDHLDFRVDRDDSVPGEESSRIYFIWDQTDDFSGPPAGYSYGSEYGKSEIEEDILAGDGPNSGLVREKDLIGHGTHVAGIAAGDGSSSSEGYIGMAPASSLIAVKTNFSTASIIDGLHYIADKASDLGGMDVVSNLSLGTQLGPHDGTSLFESAIDELVTKDHLIACSAGNSGNRKIHHGPDLSGGDRRTFTVSIPGYTPLEGTADYVSLDGYYAPRGNLEVQVIGPNGDSTAPVERGQGDSFALSGGSVLISNGPSTLNGDNEIYVRIGDLEYPNPPQPGEWTVRIRAIFGARLDLWVAANLLGNESRDVEFLHGDSEMTIAEPGNGEEVVTVGSFNSKNNWGTYSVGGYPVGELTSFSSKGPTRDGRTKPDLVAPGAWVVSSLSESASVSQYLEVSDGKHWALAGTSMAAPHVAGAAALVWYAAPELLAGEVGRLLTKRANGQGGVSPNTEWGWGKLDAKASVYGSGFSSTDLEQELWVRATPNPAEQYVDFFFNYPEDPGELKIEVYNILGEAVRSIEREKISGKLKYRWDLKNDEGVPLANGLYIYLIKTGNTISDLSRLVIRR